MKILYNVSYFTNGGQHVADYRGAIHDEAAQALADLLNQYLKKGRTDLTEEPIECPVCKSLRIYNRYEKDADGEEVLANRYCGQCRVVMQP